MFYIDIHSLTLEINLKLSFLLSADYHVCSFRFLEKLALYMSKQYPSNWRLSTFLSIFGDCRIV